MLEIILISIGILMIVATALPMVRSDAWWIRVFDFPRLQITFLAALVLVAYLFVVRPTELGELAFAAILAAGLAYQAYMMFPYTRLSGKQVQQSINPQPDSTFSLLFANVLMTNRDSEHLKEIIKESDPDIILTAEPDEWWAGQLAYLGDTYPYSVKQPQDNTYGLILYSKLELIDPQVRFLIRDDIPSIHGKVRLRSGLEVEIRCLHPRPPFPTEDETSTGRDAELLLVGKEMKNQDSPAVVFGDLNDVAWSRTNYLFQDISGLLDPRIGRGFYHTFHAKYPFIRFPLDHFFHSNHFRLVDFRRLSYFGSDHFPVYINLSYEPDAEYVQQELQADTSQLTEAREKIAEAVTAAANYARL